MLIKMKSIYSGTERERDLPITEEQYMSWRNGKLIQHAMPNLSESDVEFLLTGMTEEEWEEMCKDQSESR